jgi:hypothetical protein
MDCDGARWIEELPAGLTAQLGLVVYPATVLVGSITYVRRGSAWEALERLHEARAQVWQLWAAVGG